jgi:hypothetical protein
MEEAKDDKEVLYVNSEVGLGSLRNVQDVIF